MFRRTSQELQHDVRANWNRQFMLIVFVVDVECVAGGDVAGVVEGIAGVSVDAVVSFVGALGKIVAAIAGVVGGAGVVLVMIVVMVVVIIVFVGAVVVVRHSMTLSVKAKTIC